MDRIRAAVIACVWVSIAAAQSGNFSEEQAKRGGTLFLNKCAACHGTSLEGGQEAPPLKGDEFWSGWDRKPARALYGRILSTMPPNTPGSVPEKEVIDLVAFVAHENGLPLGTRAVESPDELNNIKLQRSK